MSYLLLPASRAEEEREIYPTILIPLSKAEVIRLVKQP